LRLQAFVLSLQNVALHRRAHRRVHRGCRKAAAPCEFSEANCGSWCRTSSRTNVSKTSEIPLGMGQRTPVIAPLFIGLLQHQPSGDYLLLNGVMPRWCSGRVKQKRWWQRVPVLQCSAIRLVSDAGFRLIADRYRWQHSSPTFTYYRGKFLVRPRDLPLPNLQQKNPRRFQIK